jgi:sugar phosphate isomerase/epimerase
MWSVSNMAWPAEADDEAIELAVGVGLHGVELVPTKIFGPWAQISLTTVADYRARLTDKGLSVAAFQGILQGTDGLRLFGDSQSRDRLRAHLEQVAVVAATAGARTIVFGAPTARDPGELPMETAFDEAVSFFRLVAPAFEAEGVCLAFEANTADWGCRFVTTTIEASRLVDVVNRPGIRLQLDTGTAFTNSESLHEWGQLASKASHLHVSEPRLQPVGTCASNHTAAGAAIKHQNYSGWRSIEMKSVANWRECLIMAAQVLQQNY